MTENTQVNIPLLRKAVEWAEAEAAKPPELCEWYQAAYCLPQDIIRAVGRSPECGTCYCVAGYVATLVSPGWYQADELAAPGIAMEALGLDPVGRLRLFAMGNTIEDVRRIAEEIAGERL